MNIRDALERARELGEVGVAVAAYRGEDLVVDEWIGSMAERDGTPVERDTLFPIFSVTKAMTATGLHLQAQRGLVDYDAPVAAYWPEFGASGKGNITVRHVLCHQSGAVAMPADITPTLVGDWEWVTSRLAEMAPLHVAGERNAYHALSFGWLVGEVIRRTDLQRRLPCQFVTEEVFAPLGIDDVWLSLPDDEGHRVAALTAAGTAQRDFSAAPLRNVSTPPSVLPVPAVYNRLKMSRACNPSAGAIATARGTARFFAMLANGGALGGVRLLSEVQVRSFLQPRPNNGRIDLVGGGHTSVGVGGYWIQDPGLLVEPLLGSRANVLYHTGAGGTIAFADLEERLAVAVCHNRMFGPPSLDRHPFEAVIDVVGAVSVD